MSYAYAIDESLNLLVVRLWGEMPYPEEAEAVSETLSDERLRPDPKILVDRRDARLTSDPSTVPAHIELVGRSISALGRPKIANVVSNESDFGMLRMLESRAEGKIDHEFKVFRDLEQACAWLEIESGAVELPER